MSRTFWIQLIICLVMLSANIGGYSIYILDEAKNAECAREMLESDNWVVPTFNYELRTDKPPLHYYFMSLAYTLFGVNAFAARFFSVVFGCMTFVITYLFATRHLSSKAAEYSGLALISFIGFAPQFHMAVPDPYLIFFVTGAVLSYYHGLTTSKSWWFYVSFGCMGLAAMSKGPVGLVIPILALAIFFWIVKPQLSKLKLWQGLLIILIVVCPWYILVGMETDGEWIRGFFFEHNLQRFAQPREGHGGFFLLTIIYLVVMTLPIGIFLFPAVGSVIKQPRNSPLILSGIVVVVAVVLFSFSATKLPNYISPALPFAALLIGDYLSRKEVLNLADKMLTTIYAIVTLVMPFVVFGDQISKGIGIEISGQYWLLLIPLGALSSLVMAYRAQLKLVIWTLAISSAMTITAMYYVIIPQIDAQNPVSLSLNKIEDKKAIVAYHIFNPAFSFYLKRPIPVFKNKEALSTFIQENESVVILTRDNVLKELQPLRLDTLLIHPNLFDGSVSAILEK